MKRLSLSSLAAALLIGSVQLSPAEAKGAPRFHESTKSPKELGECLIKHLSRSAQLRRVDANQMQVTEFDGSARETGTWVITSTPEGATAKFKPKTKSDRSSVDAELCV